MTINKLLATEISGLTIPVYNSSAANKKYVDDNAGGGISGWYDLDTGTGITAFAGAVAISGTQAETLSVAGYIASTNAITRFADSSQYSTDKATYATIADTVASSTAISLYYSSSLGAGVSGAVDLNTTHRLDNTQAHTDYLLNSESDSTSGTLTAAGFIDSGFGISSSAHISGSWIAPLYPSKPTPSTIPGEIIRVSGASGEKTWIYISVKNDADGWELVQLGVSS